MANNPALEISFSSLVLRLGRRVLRRETLTAPAVKPIVKWPGGKQWLSAAAPSLAPVGWTGHYFEPFLGGGSFFFALEPGRATLSDSNEELIATYLALREDVAGVEKLLRHYQYEESFYYKMRQRRPTSNNAVAARLLYLNRCCWNGLYRVNTKGLFNTPFGRFKNPTIYQRERLIEGARLLQRARIMSTDFEQAVSTARRGAFVYFDPPYITGHENNGFHKYNASLFSWPDQERLASVAMALTARGAHVLISNANHKAIRDIYRSLSCYEVKRQSLISGTPNSRKVVSEVLLSSYPLLGCEVT